MNKFDVTGKIQVLGEPLTKLKLSTQVKAVHEENETRTHDDSPSSNKVYEQNYDVTYGVTNTEEVNRFTQYTVQYEQHYAIEVGKIVEFDNTEVDIKFTQPWDYDISSSPAIKYEQIYTAEET